MRRDSVVYSDAVFILGVRDLTTGIVEATGTCFAITPRHIITAFHNFCQEDGVTQVSNTGLISKIVVKSGSDEIFITPFSVTICEFDVSQDWAICSLDDESVSFPLAIPICPEHSLPVLSNASIDVKCLYAPIGVFRENPFTNLVIWAESYKSVLQYDKTDETSVLVEGGLYRGSCGAPYITRNGFVLGMHLFSMHEGKDYSAPKKRALSKITIQALELTTDKTSDSVSDLADIHSLIKEGVVLSRCPRVMNFISRY
jgi:hypothetical protein